MGLGINVQESSSAGTRPTRREGGTSQCQSFVGWAGRDVGPREFEGRDQVLLGCAFGSSLLSCGRHMTLSSQSSQVDALGPM